MGRPINGPNLVNGLEGSEDARRRLLVVLETISGRRTIRKACEELGIQEAAFYKIRKKALESAMAGLEAGQAGRPRREEPPEQAKVQELEREVQSLKVDLRAAQIREEIAVMMPHLLARKDEEAKKNS